MIKRCMFWSRVSNEAPMLLKMFSSSAVKIYDLSFDTSANHGYVRQFQSSVIHNAFVDFLDDFFDYNEFWFSTTSRLFI